MTKEDKSELYLALNNELSSAIKANDTSKLTTLINQAFQDFTIDPLRLFKILSDSNFKRQTALECLFYTKNNEAVCEKICNLYSEIIKKCAENPAVPVLNREFLMTIARLYQNNPIFLENTQYFSYRRLLIQAFSKRTLRFFLLILEMDPATQDCVDNTDANFLSAIFADLTSDMLVYLIRHSVRYLLSITKVLYLAICLRVYPSIARQYIEKELHDNSAWQRHTQTILDNFFSLSTTYDEQIYLLDCMLSYQGLSLIRHVQNQWHDGPTMLERYAVLRDWVLYILNQVVNPRTAPSTFLLILATKYTKDKNKTILTAFSESFTSAETVRMTERHKVAKQQMWKNFALVFTNSGKRLSVDTGILIAQYLTFTELLSAQTLAADAKKDTNEWIAKARHNFVATTGAAKHSAIPARLQFLNKERKDSQTNNYFRSKFCVAGIIGYRQFSLSFT